MPRFIGLTGPAGVGKSTLACALAGFGFVREPFARDLKAMMRALYRARGLDQPEIEARLAGPLKETPDPLLGGATPRLAMQRLGTEWGRALAPGFWVDPWRARACAALADGAAGVVADDVRFADEAATIRALGGVVVALERPEAPRRGDHISEAGVPPDATLAVDAEPEALARRLLALCPALGPALECPL